MHIVVQGPRKMNEKNKKIKKTIFVEMQHCKELQPLTA